MENSKNNTGMKIVESAFKDLYILQGDWYEDERGKFRRTYCREDLKHSNICLEISQCNLSVNIKAGTLRGFHYQVAPFEEDKIMTAISGGIFNVALDLRKESSTYLETHEHYLDSENSESLIIPKGFANAWLTMEDNTIIHYWMGNNYSPEHSRGIRFNDQVINVKWPLPISIVSNKDLNYPDFNKY